jgi:mono/diheme cytochrome c family protein
MRTLIFVAITLAFVGAYNVEAVAAGTAGNAKAGEQVFTSNCAGCHGAKGTGQPGLFPPLAGSEIVKGDEKKLIHIVTYGFSGPLTVKGGKYNGQMPGWKGNLTDKEIADVITYVRGAWGNGAGPVSEADVKAVAK